MQSRVVVIGGGIAGMVIAREVAKRGVPVVLLEADERLGGKAGARPCSANPSIFEDHGYHIVPAWYVNFRCLLEELGLTKRLIDFDRIHYLRRGVFPKLHTLFEPVYPKHFIRNVFKFGLVHWTVQMLSLYASLDLASQSFRKRGLLDRLSANGFLRSRWYRTEKVAGLHNQLVLQASSIPSYQISAMTARRVLASYYVRGSPYHSVLNSDLHHAFVEPLQASLEELGVEIRLSTAVEKLKIQSDCVVGLELAGGIPFEGSKDDIFVAATPPEVVSQFVNSDLVAAEESLPRNDPDAKRLSDLVYLEHTPMASIHLFLRHKIKDLPREHVILHNSRYDLSFIDLSQSWQGEGGEPIFKGAALSCIASSFAPLKDLPETEAEHLLIEELREYLQFGPDDIRYVKVQTNVDKPLFLNTVGSWAFRPGTKTRLSNLFIAGDYCRSQADLTTMEGCTETALNTASHILHTLGCISGREELCPIDIPTPRRFPMRIKYWLVSPIVLVIWGVAKVRERRGAPIEPGDVDDRRVYVAPPSPRSAA